METRDFNFQDLGISKEEFEHHLNEFRKAKYFAAIKVGGGCLSRELADALTKLYFCGLYPVVVHGAGQQIDDVLKEKGIVSEKKNGKRVTDEKTLDVVVKTLKRINRNFVSDINEYSYMENHMAFGLNSIFYVGNKEPDTVYGFVGDRIIEMDKGRIDACLEKGKIPVISCLGVNAYQIQLVKQGRARHIDRGKQYFNINADSAYCFLAEKLGPLKVIMLTPPGGVYRGNDIISEMTKEELDDFINSGFADGGMELKLNEAKKLVELGFDVQITSPENLLYELFSNKGRGTYLHKKAA